MAVSDEQYERLLNRVSVLETRYNNIVVAISKFITLGQMNQLLTVLQTQIEDVRERTSSIETRVESLENEEFDS